MRSRSWQIVATSSWAVVEPVEIVMRRAPWVGWSVRPCGAFGGCLVPRASPRRAPVQASAFEQRADVGVAASQLAEGLQRVLRPAARQQRAAERLAVLPGEAAVLVVPAHGVGVEHLGPDVR